MASKQQLYQHKENLSLIIKCLRQEGSLTRKELAERTALSWGCVSESLADLIARGIVTEEKTETYRGMGRVPLCLRLSGAYCFLGVDVNEIGLHACTVDLSGRRTERFEAPLNETDEASLCASVLRFVEKILNRQPHILGIGFAMQGIYDREKDCWLFPTSNGRIPLPLGKFLRERISLPIHMEHDPNCALLSMTKGQTPIRSLLIRLDQGIGAALGQGNQLFRDGLLELGETVIDARGTRLCQAASLKALEENKDLSEEEFLRRAGHALGGALGNLCHCLFVDEILLWGGMLRYADRLLPALEESLTATYPSPPSIRAVREVDPALGAAWLAADRHVY